jgi:hypothetical protein
MAAKTPILLLAGALAVLVIVGWQQGWVGHNYLQSPPAPLGRQGSIIVTPEPTDSTSPLALPDPVALLTAATKAHRGRLSVSATLLVGINLFGEQARAEGDYLEESPLVSQRFRVDLDFRHKAQTATFRQVCDGRIFQTYTKLGNDEGTLVSLDLVRIGHSVAKRVREFATEPAPSWWPSMGGIGRILSELNRIFQFDSVTPWRINEVPVWRLEGRWEPSWLGRMMPQQEAAIKQGKPADLRKLPIHVPDHIVLFLGRQDMFPYRLECWRTGNGRSTEGAEGDSVLQIYLQFGNVRINQPVNPARFIYRPANMKATDQTELFLRGRGLTVEEE